MSALALAGQVSLGLTRALIGLSELGLDVSLAMQNFFRSGISDLLKLLFQCLLGGAKMSNSSLDDLESQQLLRCVRNIRLFVA